MFAMEGSELFFPRNPVQTEIDKRVEKKKIMSKEKGKTSVRAARDSALYKQQCGRAGEFPLSGEDRTSTRMWNASIWHYGIMTLWHYGFTRRRRRAEKKIS